ncbi:Inner membrane protein YgaP [Tsuneonella dongtanensis]|uniref:Inner membrane protein YgaP n=1 Tax=Tsuneonella dongtanensis TaxID=692370 RepID=A0A1B2A9F5_9SPHN|nr:rhodanese family protein [Tsuneonella dongtanensis]ANY18790.1 Inner membrane protein YgaP [Tsuneonella dongtanensis]
MTCQTITPAEALRLVSQGAKLIDVRGPDEFARARLPGAENRPLDALGSVAHDGPVVFHCKSGMRTAANADRLAAAAPGTVYIVEGGLEGWRKAGLPVEETKGAPLEIMRQVQIAAGTLVLVGVILGFLVAPAWFGLSAFVGAGLTFAGVSGWCGMAHLLAIMPWNRQAAQA